MNNLSFSQRAGLSPVNIPIQKDDINTSTRNRIWNLLKDSFCRTYRVTARRHSAKDSPKLLTVWDNFLKEDIDNIPTYSSDVDEYFRVRIIQRWKWHEIYDFVEFLEQHDLAPMISANFSDRFNHIMESEISAYRLINGFITPIIDEIEIQSIEHVLNSNPYESVKIHLKSSLNYLSQKPHPDVRTSIKESVSAIEAACIQLSGKKATLNKALLHLKDMGVNIHPALNKGFSSLYAYTGDGDGIRHALLEEPNLKYEDALYFLVASSAFVNYLMSKSDTIHGNS